MTKTTSEKLAGVTDYIGIGLKASLDPIFYKERFGVGTEPILEAATVFAEKGCEVLLTNLTDPKLWEDSGAYEALTEWVVRNMRSDTRLILAHLETTERKPVTPKEPREAHLQRYRKLATEKGLRQVHFQVDMRKASEEKREYLRKIGYFRTLEKLGISIAPY
jgi:pyruvate-formate lyase-activating enzyme